MRTVRTCAGMLWCAIAVAACGAPSHGAVSAAPPAKAPATRLADGVCRTVLAGAPAPLPEQPSARRLRAYINAAAPSATRTARSLQRLGGLDELAGAYVRLRAAYAVASSERSPAHARRLIEAREGAVTAAALAARVPACALGAG